MAAAKYNALTAVISAAQKKEYRYSTEQAVFPGWKVVAGYEQENTVYAYLKTLKSVEGYKKIVAKVTVKELKSHYTEAKLVQILEEKGIGRPSTFASLIEKIQERGYVKRDNVVGKKLKCTDYELEGEELSEIENTREFGNEKNKLVIQSVGIMVIEFLLSNFAQFFDYDYTKTMENNLDKIANNQLVWHNLCRECLDDIDKTPCIQEKKQYQIDNNHVYMVGKYGPVVKYTSDDGEITKFKNVKKDIDVSKIEKGEYTLEDLLEEQHSRSLGKYKGDDVFIKKGKYGYYAQCGKKTQSLARYDNDILEITLDDVVGMFGETSKDVVRAINDDASIRKSKYGLYIYYKTQTHKKPEFISLKNFKENVEECDLSMITQYVEQHKKK
jgi:DNA topoisomerase-1